MLRSGVSKEAERAKGPVDSCFHVANWRAKDKEAIGI
jgi:hypothetical protein